MLRARWRLRRRARAGGIGEVLATILLVAITLVLLILVYEIRFPLPNPPPTFTYATESNVKFAAWGDPTDCYPNLPHNWEYYLSNGTGNTTDTNRYNTYMTAWDNECDPSSGAGNGTYNLMNATEITITGVSQTVPLSALEFEFICTNTTPKETTTFVSGSLDQMEWVPGSPSANLTTSSPTLGTCATYDPKGSGSNSVYYNRLGFFDPLDTQRTIVAPGMSLVIYVHTADSIFEAPNPLYDDGCNPMTSSCDWGQPDSDDYHGAPVWCFESPGSCTIELIDTDWSYPVVVLSAPVYML